MADTNQPLIPMKCFDSYIVENNGLPSIIEQCAPRLWRHMCNLRNVLGNRKLADKKNVIPRMRQAFCKILAMRRQRNAHQLVWWSMVWAISFYGWGVGRTALNASNYTGLTYNSATRDRRLAVLTNDITQRRTRYMSSFDRIVEGD